MAANPELQERELIKLAKLAARWPPRCARRGVAEPAATLAAEAGIAVFKVAFQRWVDGAGPAWRCGEVIRDCLAELKTVTGCG